VPNPLEQEYIHKKIVKELENGIVNNETKKEFLNIVTQMINRDGIQGIILGCTELPMLIKNEDLNIHQLNTTEIHVNKIADTIFMDKNY
jgi:aspartate racemase